MAVHQPRAYTHADADLGAPIGALVLDDRHGASLLGHLLGHRHLCSLAQLPLLLCLFQNLELQGFDSSRSLILRCGIPRSIGIFPEIYHQRLLVCGILVRGLAIRPNLYLAFF